MNTKVFNLALMTMWLVLCIGLLTRDWWMPDGLRDRINGPNTPVVIAVAGLLAVWNFVRFFVARRYAPPGRLSPEVEEYRRRIRAISGEDPKVTDPQFKFDDDGSSAQPRTGHPS
jgi:hypothetical protein